MIGVAVDPAPAHAAVTKKSAEINPAKVKAFLVCVTQNLSQRSSYVFEVAVQSFDLKLLL